jgi:hypothetical protein
VREQPGGVPAHAKCPRLPIFFLTVPGYTEPLFNQVSFPQAEYEEDPKKNTHCQLLPDLKKGYPNDRQ